MRQQVDSDRQQLADLHQRTGWTPAAIRPSPEAIAQKKMLLANAIQRYSSVRDYVLHRIFKIPATSQGGFLSSALSCTEDQVRLAQRSPAEREAGKERKVVFVENLFPYEVPIGTHHYVLWFLLDTDETEERMHISDQDITALLDSTLIPPSAEFVWYRNPKPTISDGITYHVQVFWRNVHQ